MGLQTSTAIKVPEVKGVTFTQHNGYISEGGDLLRVTMTISEAMRKAATLPGCQGFCFRGDGQSHASGAVDVWFKNKCSGALCECAEKWTSYQLMRDNLVSDPPHPGIKQTPAVFKTPAPNVTASVAVRREESDKSSDMQSQITLIVRTLGGCDLTFEVPAQSTTLGALKVRIQQELGEAHKCSLCLDTRFLSDDSATLSALGISDKTVLTLARRPEFKWNVQGGRAVEGISRRGARGEGETRPHIVCTESHHDYDKELNGVIKSAKTRCEEQDWAGFVIVNSTSKVLHTGLCDYWPDPLACQIYYLEKPFRAGADSIPAAAEVSETSSGVNVTTTTYTLHFLE